MGFEPMSLRDLVVCSNHWATGDYGKQEWTVGLREGAFLISIYICCTKIQLLYLQVLDYLCNF